jgi:hypothetical protein
MRALALQEPEIIAMMRLRLFTGGAAFRRGSLD